MSEKYYVERLIRRWEAEDRKRPPPAPLPKPVYATAQSTIDAFWYLIKTGDIGRLDNWLKDHPLDYEFLIDQAKKDPDRVARLRSLLS